MTITVNTQYAIHLLQKYKLKNSSASPVGIQLPCILSSWIPILFLLLKSNTRSAILFSRGETTQRNRLELIDHTWVRRVMEIVFITTVIAIMGTIDTPFCIVWCWQHDGKADAENSKAVIPLSAERYQEIMLALRRRD